MLQEYEPPPPAPVAVKVTVFPGQIVAPVGVIVTFGDWLTLTFLDADAVHPPFDTVTEY